MSHRDAELADAWIEGEDDARWRSGSGHGPDSGAAASGSSLLEIPPGCRLPRHTDSAEELIVVLDGEAAVTVGSETAAAPAGAVALVAADTPHEVRNAGDGALRFVAVYAATEGRYPLRGSGAAGGQPRAAAGRLRPMKPSPGCTRPP